MKKNLLIVCICELLTTVSATSFVQKLSFGEFAGINFSNLHGNLTSNKWEPMLSDAIIQRISKQAYGSG